MKFIKYTFALVATAVIMASCSKSGPILATDSSSQKKGTAEYSVILGIFRPKDADISIATAAKNGDISNVATVDYQIESKLFKTTYRTIVTGN